VLRLALLLGTLALVLGGCGGQTKLHLQPTPGYSTSARLPGGVSLQAIGGGTCSSSQGPCYDNYYCSHDFTNACNAGNAYPAKSWDDPSFFPIAQDYYGCGGSNPSAWLAEKLNVASRIDSSCSPATFGTQMKDAGLWAIVGSDNYTDTEGVTTGYGPETVGFHIDEPLYWTNNCSGNPQAQPAPSVTCTANADATFSSGGVSGRFIQPVWTASTYPNASVAANGSAVGSNAIPSSCGPVTNPTIAMQSIMSCTSGMPDGTHPDISSSDAYWFAGANLPNGPVNSNVAGFCRELYGSQCSGTPDQLGRGSNYGDAIDAERAWGNYPAAVYIETGSADGTSSYSIKPAEFNWAAWDTIIHGARMLLYFYSGSAPSTAGFPTTSVGGTTMAAQGAATDGLVQNLAPIINSPFALNFATNNAGGYVFPTEHLVLDNGLDMSVHYYTGSPFTNSAGTFSPGFYIIVAPRGSESQTMPQTYTFTLPTTDSTPTGTIQDVCACSPTQSTGSVNYNSSTHSFTDTFKKVSDVHIIGPFR
jgi:hypothetical protein